MPKMEGTQLNKAFVIISFIASILILELTSADTRLNVEAPVSPVKHGGILSIHCQIWELQSDLHEVTISRQVRGQRSQRLSMGDVIMQNWEDRIFLAIRQLGDGTVVYFLSITQVTTADAGSYSCELFTDSLRRVIDDDRVEIEVEYFPEDEPECIPPVSLDIHAGVPVEIACNTPDAYPGVELLWRRTGTGIMPPDVLTKTDGAVSSRLTYLPDVDDTGVMFFCEVTSVAFPDVVKKCHIGPFTVKGTRGVHEPGVYVATKSPVDKSPVDTERNTVQLDGPVVWDRAPGEKVAPQCQDLCEEFNAESTLFWIICTVVISCFAGLFAVISIIVAVKYTKMTREGCYVDRSYSIRRCVPDSMYEVPVYTKNENDCIYMPLNKPVCMIESKQFTDEMGDSQG